MVRTFMVHSSLHWTYHGADEISLWYFSIKYAVWFHNCLPNYRSGITPLEFFTSNKADHRELSISYVWEYPIFVLDPKLQFDKKMKKYNWRYCLGKFLGFSEHHSSLIANVRHINNGHISPQYQVVFENLFETVYITGENDLKVNAVCNNLFDQKHYWYVLEEYDEERNLVYKYPPLREVWLTYTDH